MFRFGRTSLARMEGVHPRLVRVAHHALEISEVDFGIGPHGGLRTVEDQRKLKARGVTRTMNSKHLPQSDGYGHALDLVPYIDGRLQWLWEPIYKIAAAVRIAAEEEGLSLRWGGVWDRELADLAYDDLGDTMPVRIQDDSQEIRLAVSSYVERRRAAGRSAFIDGPHYEIRGLE